MPMDSSSSIHFTRTMRQTMGDVRVAVTVLQAAAQTDRGASRAENQDSILAEVAPDDTTGLFAVADGMGGQVAGGIASEIAIETLRTHLLPIITASEDAENDGVAGEPLTVRVHDAIVRCHERILQYTEEHEESRGMGSTLTLALVRGSLAIVGNIGDSRTYRIRDGEIESLTHDHSLVAHLAAIGQIEPDDVYSHPQRSIIYRALGGDGEVQPDIFTERLQKGDTLLLCSDGLWEMVRDDVLRETIRDADTIEDAARSLVTSANANGGTDNISVILVRAL